MQGESLLGAVRRFVDLEVLVALSRKRCTIMRFLRCAYCTTVGQSIHVCTFRGICGRFEIKSCLKQRLRSSPLRSYQLRYGEKKKRRQAGGRTVKWACPRKSMSFYALNKQHWPFWEKTSSCGRITRPQEIRHWNVGARTSDSARKSAISSSSEMRFLTSPI